jgi:hypothetical protein
MRDKLFMVLLGCRPAGRNTEQHDIFFGVAGSLHGLLPQMKTFWPGVKLHIDAYIVIDRVGEYNIEVLPNNGPADSTENGFKLFLLNLGGYSPPDFEEYHKKILVVAEDISKAIAESKKDNFYTSGQKLEVSARSHIDDKMDVDDIISVQELIPSFKIHINKADMASSESIPEMHIGYIPLSKISSLANGN